MIWDEANHLWYDRASIKNQTLTRNIPFTICKILHPWISDQCIELLQIKFTGVTGPKILPKLFLGYTRSLLHRLGGITMAFFLAVIITQCYSSWPRSWPLPVPGFEYCYDRRVWHVWILKDFITIGATNTGVS